MSKSVYIMDTPEKCEDCQFFRCTTAAVMFTCGLKGTGLVDAVLNANRSDGCPLIDIPDRKEEIKPEDFIHSDSALLGEATGWNSCLDYILGGLNEDD